MNMHALSRALSDGGHHPPYGCAAAITRLRQAARQQRLQCLCSVAAPGSSSFCALPGAERDRRGRIALTCPGPSTLLNWKLLCAELPRELSGWYEELVTRSSAGKTEFMPCRPLRRALREL
jgi:hypothetical protein